MLQTYQQLSLSDKDFLAISQVIYEHCGIHLREEKKELVRSRLSRLVHQHRCSSFGDYLELVLKDPKGPDFAAFINRISTNLTSFFREEHHFQYLRETLLPRWKNAHRQNPRLRIWSAGCSTGEEPYSIAMTVADALGNELTRSDVKILASDISTRVLQAAQQGRYAAERLQSVPVPMRQHFFSALSHDQFEAGATLKKLVLFRQINLMQPWPIKTPLDVIFCRNVMIYFDKSTQERLVERFTDLLKKGGTLFIGHSESLSNVNHSLRYAGPTIYEKP